MSLFGEKNSPLDRARAFEVDSEGWMFVVGFLGWDNAVPLVQSSSPSASGKFYGNPLQKAPELHCYRFPRTFARNFFLA